MSEGLSRHRKARERSRNGVITAPRRAAAARGRGETAVGYRIAELADRSDRHYGVVINPRKSDEVTFAERDRVIVLAER